MGLVLIELIPRTIAEPISPRSRSATLVTLSLLPIRFPGCYGPRHVRRCVAAVSFCLRSFNLTLQSPYHLTLTPRIVFRHHYGMRGHHSSLILGPARVALMESAKSSLTLLPQRLATALILSTPASRITSRCATTSAISAWARTHRSDVPALVSRLPRLYRPFL